MRAGELRRRVTIQQRVTTQDTFGGQSQTWADFAAHVPAAIEPLSGRELMTAQSTQSEVSHRITIRYLPGVTAAMRIVYQGRYFNISAVMNIEERNREMQILASEGLNNG